MALSFVVLYTYMYMYMYVSLSHHTSRRLVALVGSNASAISLAKLHVYFGKFFASKDVVVLHIVYVDAFTFAIAKTLERFFHDVHALVYCSVLNK